MKKYIIPEVKVLKIEMQQIIASSITQSAESATVSDGVYSNSLGRDYDFDDDED